MLAASMRSRGICSKQERIQTMPNGMFRPINGSISAKRVLRRPMSLIS